METFFDYKVSERIFFDFYDIAGMRQSLPFGKQLAYASGMMGWSIMINLIGVILVYMFLPPAGSGLQNLVTQTAFLGIFNAMAIIMSSGRLVDAVYDPFIAQISDSSKNPKGRRIPIMKWAILPSMVFCFLVFHPFTEQESSGNIAWLVVMLVGFYVSSTTYIIPYNALLPEMATTSEEKVKLATWQSVGYVFGIGVASNAFNVVGLLQHSFGVVSKLTAIQYTVFGMVCLAGVCMLVTVLAIDERKYSGGQHVSVPMKQALAQTLRNKRFLLFVVADFSYFISVTLITSGLLYYLTALLRMKDETLGNRLMITMVLVSFLFYPVINVLSRKAGKKILVVISFVILSLVFLGVYFLGKPAIDARLQIYSLIVLAAIPLASLNILPNAILAEIIEKDTLDTGTNKEGVYFAVRYFFVKIAQTFGMAFFSMLLLYGKDPGNDLGVRLTGILGFALCLLAAIVFTRFRETKS